MAFYRVSLFCTWKKPRRFQVGFCSMGIRGVHPWEVGAAFSREARVLTATVCTSAPESSPAKRPTKSAVCEHDHGSSKHPSFWDREEDAQLCGASGGYGSLLAGDPVHGAVRGRGPPSSLPAQLKLRSIPSPLLPFLRAVAFLCYFPLGLQFFPASHRQYIKHILLKFFQQKLHWNNF